MVGSGFRAFAVACCLIMPLCTQAQYFAGDITEQTLRSRLAEAEQSHGPLSRPAFEALLALARHLEESGREQDVLDVTERVLPIFEQIMGPNDPDPGHRLNEVAQRYFKLGRYADAARHLKRSVEILERTLPANDPDTAVAYVNLGLSQVRLGLYDDAEPNYRRALQILLAQPQPDLDAVANTENNLAQLFHLTARPADALQAAQRSLDWTLKLAAPSPASLSSRYNNLALANSAMGRHAAALQAKERSVAIDLQRHGPRHPEYAKALNDLAILQQAVGEVSNAQASIQSARELLGVSLAGRPEQAALLNTEAQVLGELGDHAGALSLLRRALVVQDAASAPLGDIARTLSNIGMLQLQLGQIYEGITTLERSVQLMSAQMPINALDVSTVQHNLAAAYASAGRFAQASDWAQISLQARIKILGSNHPSTLDSRLLSSLLQLLAGNVASAMSGLHEVLVIQDMEESAHVRAAYTRGAIGLAHAMQQQPDAAIAWGKQAVNSMQLVRQGISTLDPALQLTFAEKHRELYRTLADLLISQDRHSEAQQVLQMLKEHEFHESVRGAGADRRLARAPLTAREAAAMAHYEALRARQDATAMKAYLTDLAAELAATPRTEASPDTVQRTQTRLSSAIDHLAREVPGARAVGLQYVATESRLSILITSAGKPVAVRQVPVGRRELNGVVAQYLAQLGYADVDPAYLNHNARKLHAWLIAPIQDKLVELRARTLMLSLTDALRLVPFAALHDGERYLVQQYTIAWFNEAATPALAASPVQKWRVAAMGLSQPVGGLSALQGVPDELKAVVGTIGGDQFLNGAFRRDSLRSSLSGGYNVLHLASHYVHNAARPETSRLYLGDQSQLTLGEILRENMRFDSFELVAFSACSTALSASPAAADGQMIESLGATAQLQGARSVLATLWQVADKSTSQLMQTFYRERSRSPDLNKAQALREAQLAMLEGRLRPPSQRDGNWSAPYHWAPFVLMGNWR